MLKEPSESAAVCAVCFDSVHGTQGFDCPQKCETFTCWDCLSQCYTMVARPDAIKGQSNSDGELLCSSGVCKHPIKIVDLAKSSAPEAVLKAQESFKIQVLTSKKVTEALSQQDRRIRAEYARIEQIKDADEKAAVKLRMKIIDKVLTLRCPQCKTVFLDFEGCFALKCSSQNCGCGFCAWCLKDCGEDAHEHVPKCPENPGKTPFNTEAAFNNHHRTKRINAMQLMIKQAELSKSAIEKLKALLKTDLQDLQIQLSDVFLTMRVETRFIALPSYRGLIPENNDGDDGSDRARVGADRQLVQYRDRGHNVEWELQPVPRERERAPHHQEQREWEQHHHEQREWAQLDQEQREWEQQLERQEAARQQRQMEIEHQNMLQDRERQLVRRENFRRQEERRRARLTFLLKNNNYKQFLQVQEGGERQHTRERQLQEQEGQRWAQHQQRCPLCSHHQERRHHQQQAPVHPPHFLPPIQARWAPANPVRVPMYPEYEPYFISY